MEILANLRICQTANNQGQIKGSGSVRVIHVYGFGSVRGFEFYIFFGIISSNSVRFFPKYGIYIVRFVFWVRWFYFHKG